MGDLQDLVGNFPAPAVIVDRKAGIIASNQNFIDTLKACGLDDVPTLYSYGSTTTHMFIRQAINAACDTGEMQHATIPLRHAHVRAALTLMPLSDLVGDDPLYANLCFGVFHELKVSRMAAMAMVERDYNLSEHETYFVTHLLAGHSLSEAANHMDMSRDQAGRELKEVFLKTSTSTLEELASLVDDLAIA